MRRATFSRASMRTTAAQVETAPLADFVSVVHQSVVILFARTPSQPVTQLFYTVLLDPTIASTDASGWSGWNSLSLVEACTNADGTPAGSDAQPMLRVAGADLLTVPMSLTATSPADAPFRVVSDGQRISIFRVSSSGTLYVDRFVLVQGTTDNASAEETEPDTGWTLQRAWEVRYKRSQQRDVGSGPSDTLDSRDMLDRAFLEPTSEICGLSNIAPGQFTVLLVPSSTPGQGRWTFFVASSATITITSFAEDATGRVLLGSQTTNTLQPSLAGGQPLTFVGALAATLFNEQEASSADDAPFYIRRATKVMLGAPACSAAAGLSGALVVLDFLVQSDGTLPAWPDVPLPLIDGQIVNGQFQPQQADSYPIPDSAVHGQDSALVAGFVLGQVMPSGCPLLLDSSDGLVRCYFAGASGFQEATPFLVAQFDPEVTRAIYTLPWQASGQAGDIAFIAQRSGTSMNSVAIACNPCTAGSDFCQLTLDYGVSTGIPSETWDGMPTEMDDFLAILGGLASPTVNDPAVQNGSAPFYDYGGQQMQLLVPIADSDTAFPHFNLVSLRADLTLSSASVGASSDGVTTLTLTFTAVAPSASLTQTWSNMPLATDQCLAILRGGASPATYNYVAATSDAVFYGLDCGSTLLVAVQPGQAWSFQIDPADNLDPSCCNLVVTVGTVSTPLSNIERDQASVSKALQGASISGLVAVSMDGAGGVLQNQTVSTALDLRANALLFGIYAPDPTGSLVTSTPTATQLQGHRVASQEVTNSLIAMAAVATSRPQFGQSAVVTTGQATTATPGQNGAWRAAPQRQAFDVVSTNSATIDLAPASARQLAPQRAMTLEAWINPDNSDASAVVAYCDEANSVPLLGGVPPTLLLTTTGLPVLTFSSCSQCLGHMGPAVFMQSCPAFDLYASTPSPFTWEAWIRPDGTTYPPGTFGVILEGIDNVDAILPQFMLGLDDTNILQFGYRTGTQIVNATASYLNSSVVLSSDVWTHVAVTGVPVNGTWTFSLYVNAALANAQDNIALLDYDTGPPAVYFGASDGTNISLCGSIADIRFWQVARTSIELQRAMDTRLTGTEPALSGYWPLAGFSYVNLAASSSLPPASPVNASNQQQSLGFLDDDTFLDIQASVGGLELMQAKAFLRTGDWNHVALTYQAAGAVALNLDGIGAVPDFGADRGGQPLRFTDANSVEAWVISAAAQPDHSQTLVACWGTDAADQAFQLALGQDGTPTCQMNATIDSATELLQISGSNSICDGQPHHLVATWSTVPSSTSSTSSDKSQASISLYVDGALVQTTTSSASGQTVQVISSNAPLTFGISALGDADIASQAPLSGVLAAIRLWTACLSGDQVQSAMTEGRAYTGPELASAWWFDETTGATAADSEGAYLIKFNSVDLWTEFAQLATMAVYANGALVPTTISGAAPKLSQGFSIGAPASAFGGMQGQIDELRIWSCARSPGQIVQSMFHPLLGNERGLVGYWPFDGTLADATGSGNDGSANGVANYSISTAPVSNEGPLLRNVYGGTVTAQQESLAGTPAIVEFGAMPSSMSQEPTPPELRRGYLFQSGNGWPIFDTRFGLGELDMTYLGQVQTQPTLIGFVEGAPPVPSENLTRPLYTNALGYNDYADTSSVTLTQEETTTFSFMSTDHRTTFSMDTDFSFGAFSAADTSVNSPFVVVKAFQEQIKAGISGKSHFSQGNERDARYDSGWSRASSITVGLRGAWEVGLDNASYLNPQVGRRYQPDNHGVAVVESITADVYAMSLAATGAMVGKIVVPDVTQGPQRGILTFRINPSYIKNGTLDGKIGFANDPSYPNADFVRGSYYKPEEADQLRQQIEGEEAALRSYCDQFDASRGASLNPDISDVAAAQFVDPTTGQARKGLVNDYAWDARGGLLKDEEQFLSSYNRTYSGLGSWNMSGGVSASLEFAFVVGVYGGVDMLFGGGVDVSVSNAETDSRIFGLTAEAAGEPFLFTYNGSSGNDGYSTTPTPGKVLTYRFSTVFLPPDPVNASTFLSQVVDPVWLQNSDDPDAISLRGANLSTQSPWRVLHRVTYVSRVPPNPDASPQQNGKAELDTVFDVNDNMLLNQLVSSRLTTVPATPAAIGQALQDVLLPPSGGSASVLGALIPWWDKFVASAAGQSPTAPLLDSIERSLMSYLINGFATGVLPAAAATAVSSSGQAID